MAAVEDLVRDGVEVRVVDHATGDDVTEVVLARVWGSMLRASGTGMRAVLESLLRAPGEIAKAGAESLVGHLSERGATKRRREPEPEDIAQESSEEPKPEDVSEIGQLRNLRQTRIRGGLGAEFIGWGVSAHCVGGCSSSLLRRCSAAAA